MATIAETNAAYHNHEGRTLYLQGQFLKAIPHFEHALHLHPNLWEAHYNLAHSLVQIDQFPRAAFHYQEVLRIHPNHPNATFNVNTLFADPNLHLHHNLAILYLNNKDKSQALRHFKEALKIEPHNDTARHMVIALSGEPSSDTPKNYIADLFNQYAEYYNSHMKETLRYQAPSLLRSAIGKTLPLHAKACRILDLGCGTGLCGVYFRDMALELIGVDLSKQMIAEAEKLNGYDALIISDMNDYLNTPKLAPFDLIVAADVLVYSGGLDRLFQNVAQCLKSGGRFAFTVEDLEAQSATHSYPIFALQPTGRYAHSSAYIHKLAAQYQLDVEWEENMVPRMHEGVPVHGKLYIFNCK